MSQPQWSPYGSGRASSWHPTATPYGGGFAPPTPNPGFGAPGRTGPAAWGHPPPGSAYPASQPRARNPLRLVLLAVIALAVVAIVGLVVVNAATRPAEVAYQNDDYRVPPPDTNPPPIPIPEDYDQAEQLVTASPFYAQSVTPPVRCTAVPINVDTANDAQLKTHFENMMECLIRVWQPPINAAQLRLVRPTVTIYGSKLTTKCGTTGVNAFYCAADQQVYYSNRLAKEVPIVAQDKWAADAVIAHEFGHALQGRTGILIAAKALGQHSGDDATDLLYTRRLETQADCFSGMFMRTVSRSLGIQQTDLDGINATFQALGDDALTGDPNIVADHGHSATRQFWADTGLGNNAVGTCNTFVAPESQLN